MGTVHAAEVVLIQRSAFPDVNSNINPHHGVIRSRGAFVQATSIQHALNDVELAVLIGLWNIRPKKNGRFRNLVVYLQLVVHLGRGKAFVHAIVELSGIIHSGKR